MSGNKCLESENAFWRNVSELCVFANGRPIFILDTSPVLGPGQRLRFNKIKYTPLVSIRMGMYGSGCATLFLPHLAHRGRAVKEHYSV